MKLKIFGGNPKDVESKFNLWNTGEIEILKTETIATVNDVFLVIIYVYR